MNEQQKKIMKELNKKIGFLILSIGGIFVLSGGSLDLINKFTAADMIGKGFFVIFVAFGAYNLGMGVKGLGEMKRAGNTNINQGISQQGSAVVGGTIQASGITKEPDIFEQFNQELSRDLNNPGSIGDLTGHLKGKIEEFNQKLDSDVTELEQQYVEMDKLRKEVIKMNDDLHKDYQKLEQQMHITNGMIKTKRMVRDRVKQIRESK